MNLDRDGVGPFDQQAVVDGKTVEVALNTIRSGGRRVVDRTLRHSIAGRLGAVDVDDRSTIRMDLQCGADDRCRVLDFEVPAAVEGELARDGGVDRSRDGRVGDGSEPERCRSARPCRVIEVFRSPGGAEVAAVAEFPLGPSREICDFGGGAKYLGGARVDPAARQARIAAVGGVVNVSLSVADLQFEPGGYLAAELVENRGVEIWVPSSGAQLAEHGCGATRNPIPGAVDIGNPVTFARLWRSGCFCIAPSGGFRDDCGIDLIGPSVEDREGIARGHDAVVEEVFVRLISESDQVLRVLNCPAMDHQGVEPIEIAVPVGPGDVVGIADVEAPL